MTATAFVFVVLWQCFSFHQFEDFQVNSATIVNSENVQIRQQKVKFKQLVSWSH